MLNNRFYVKQFDSFLSPLFRELVADITITDNAQATTVSSLITGICTAVEPCILGGWIKNTSQSYLELGVILFCLTSY